MAIDPDNPPVDNERTRGLQDSAASQYVHGIDHPRKAAGESVADSHAEKVGMGESWFAGLIESHRSDLRNMVAARMDPRLQQRFDPSDVVQETYVEATRRRGEFLRQSTVPLMVWLRFLAQQQLLILYRRHLGTRMRDVRREMPQDVIAAEAESFAASANASPVGQDALAAAIEGELRTRLHQVLQTLSSTDREILMLRHFEQLSNSDAAERLNLTTPAACNRYMRALERLRQALRETSPGSTDWRI
jgi:RNA polymerase sigma-70 factor (ECF subfamily)